MIPADRKAFLEVVVGFAELRGKVLSAAALELYWRSMQAWSIEDFRAAATRLVKTSEFMPTPKQFEDLRRASQPTGGEVFAGIRQWLEYSPLGYRIKASTPRRIACSLAAIGGAQGYAMCDADKLHFLEKRFCEHYEQIGEAEDTREALPQIVDERNWLTLQTKMARLHAPVDANGRDPKPYGKVG